jgi:FHS family L-fucose permease-like MFS transporter
MHLGAATTSTSTANSPRRSIFPAGFMLPFLLTTLIFFVWGMSNNLTDILVQQFRKSFSLSLLQAQLVQTAVFLAYGTMAIPAALFMRRFGYKVGLLTGLIVFGIGTLLFWPAAVLGQYIPFLISLFVVGSGSSVLETAANPLIAQFGDPATSEQRLNFAQAFNPPGTILGVLVGTWFIFSGIEKTPAQVAAMTAQGTYAAYLHSEILRVVPTYVALGIAVLVLATCIGLARFPANLDAGMDAPGEVSKTPVPQNKGSMGRLLRTPHLMFAVVAQFFYVGAQVSTWSTYIPYMRAYTSVSEKTSGYFLTGTLAAFALGRIVSTPLMRYIAPGLMMGFYAIINLVLMVASVLHPGMFGAYAILVKLLHVCDVSNYFCPGGERPGRGYQIRRQPGGDVDRERRSLSAVDGLGCAAYWKHRRWLRASRDWLWSGGTLCISGATGEQEHGRPRAAHALRGELSLFASGFAGGGRAGDKPGLQDNILTL